MLRENKPGIVELGYTAIFLLVAMEEEEEEEEEKHALQTSSCLTWMPMDCAVPMMDLLIASSDMYWQSGSDCLILAIS